MTNRAGEEEGDEEPADIEDNVDVKSFIMPNNSVSIAVTFKASTTGIHTIKDNTQRQDGKWYTLSGVAVEKPTKGLYIHNGKKVVIKWAKWELAHISERERARTKFKVIIK